MDQVTAFLGARFDDWRALISKPETGAVLVFLVLLLVADLYRRGWKLSWSRRALRGIWATIAIFHLNFLCVPLVWLAVVLIQQGYQALNVPRLDENVWSGFPAWALVPIALFTHDFANYWAHRVLHLRWLWPIHAIHHSDHDVNGLSAYRIHAFETVVMWASYTLLLTWIGLPEDAIGIGAVLLALHIVYVHVDIDWHHGPFRMWLASPRFHRWHHADIEEAYGKNLAGMFPIFDRLFGTYYEAGRCDVPLGARGVPANDIVALMLYPFTEWGRMIGQAASRARRRAASGIEKLVFKTSAD